MRSTADLPRLLDESVQEDPYSFYRALRESDPVHYDDQTSAYLITRHADVAAAYRNPVFSTQNYEWQLEPVMGRTLLQLDGQEHARTRALVGPHFRGAGLARWSPIIERNVAALLEGAAEAGADALTAGMAVGEEVDVVTRFAHYLPVYVIADMLALPKSDHARFYSWYTAQSDFLSNLGADPEVDARGRAVMAEMRHYLRPIVAERRGRPGDDLISVLANAEVDGETLDDAAVITHVTHLLNAGSETTDRTIANLLLHLLTRRELFEAVREDRTLTTAAIGETLRLTPPSQLNGRVATQDVDVCGRTIPSGAFAMLVIASANRDERRFDQPDSFDLWRTDMAHDKAFTSVGEHFAFGHGRHFCLGAMVAKVELETSLNILLDRFPTMRLADGPVPVSRGIKMRSPVSLRVVL
ncbi:MAG: hypothetical protein ABS81_01120 [Pseudonocardia sp. SCN 72-86]|nr:MAG: hypothetical protein ABS81_01120 [Pseudonocardia sp. SCN 72-86]